MQVLNELQMRALGFIASANRGGFKPTKDQVQVWIEHPHPQRARRGPLLREARPPEYLLSQFDAINNIARIAQGYTTQNLLRGLSPFLSGTPAQYGPDVPAESALDHLIRLDWIGESGSGLQVTALGRALLRTAEADDEEATGADTVVLGADNDLSYPTLISRISEAEDGLLIDPYIRVDQILDVRTHTSVQRVLLSEALSKTDRTSIAVFVENLQSSGSFEVRMAKSGVLHDRFIVGSNFVCAVGTSMNTVGKKYATVVSPLPDVAADAVREQAATWWEDATVLASWGLVKEAPEAESDSSDPEAEADTEGNTAQG